MAGSTALLVALLAVLLVVAVLSCPSARQRRASRFHPGYGLFGAPAASCGCSGCASCREADGCGPRPCPDDGTLWTKNWYNYNQFENFAAARHTEMESFAPTPGKTGGWLFPRQPPKVYSPFACEGAGQWTQMAGDEAAALSYVEAGPGTAPGWLGGR